MLLKQYTYELAERKNKLWFQTEHELNDILFFLLPCTTLRHNISEIYTGSNFGRQYFYYGSRQVDDHQCAEVYPNKSCLLSKCKRVKTSLSKRVKTSCPPFNSLKERNFILLDLFLSSFHSFWSGLVNETIFK